MKQVLQPRRSATNAVRDVPAPACAPGGVLVRNAFSAISAGTERARVEASQQSLLGRARARPDLVREVVKRARRDGLRATARNVGQRLSEETAVGYSSAGIVLEVGEHARGFVPGDRVACAGGGHANHAEIVAIPSNLCAPVPEGVSLEAASVSAIAGIALHGIRLADVTLASRTAVIGCGLVGQIALRLLRSAGAETIALDIDSERVAQALAGGADHASLIGAATGDWVRSLTGGAGADQVIVAAGASTSEPLRLATEIARDRGRLVLVGAVPIDLPREQLFRKELSFQVSRSYGPGRYDAEYEERGLDLPLAYVRWTERRNIEAVLSLQARGELDLSDLIEVVPLAQAPSAFERIAGRSGPPPRGVLVIDYGYAAPAAEPAPATEPLGAAMPEQTSKTAVTGRAVRIGLIGPGNFANAVLLPALTAAGAELDLVGGGSGPSAAAGARSGPFRRTAPDIDSLIADPAVDAVVIATRHSDHARLTTAALAAGKHVFCEKPLALTEDEASAVLAAAAGAQGTLLAGFNRRFAPLLMQMREFLAAAGGQRTFTYRVSAGKLAEDHWTHDLSQGGGRVLGEGCHFIDTLANLAGSPIVEVHAYGHGPPGRARQAHDNLTISLRMANGSVAGLAYVADGAGGLAKERIEGFAGRRSAVLDDFSSLELYEGAAPARRHEAPQDKGHRAELQAFIDGVRAGRQAVPLDELANSTYATLAVVESLCTGLPVAVAAPA